MVREQGAGSGIRRFVDRCESFLLAALLTLMTLITFAQVIARYVFNYSFVWALELTTFLFGGLIFFGISYGVRVGAHIGVDVVVRMLSDRVARRVALVAAVLCLVYAGIVFVGGWIYVGKMYDIGILAQDMPIPQWVPKLVLPLGFAMLLVRFAEVLWRIASGRQSSLLGDEVKDALKHRADAPDDGPDEGATR
ncbi:MAG: TRAP transporter small permease [Gammaproteobacteria bacterium]